MFKKVSSSQAKVPSLSAGGRRCLWSSPVIIERRGKPLAALVSVSDLERLEQDRSSSRRPLGALALVGAWREIEDKELDGIVAQVLTNRGKDEVRRVELEG